LRRIKIIISGRVQGVGFRPFVYRSAHSYSLTGHVRNTPTGVIIEVQGERQVIDCFLTDLQRKKPENANIRTCEISEIPLAKNEGFQIKSSIQSSDTALALLPDTAVCKTCLQELFDPNDRRYLYPFLHCTVCGPRFSLFTGMPFDRERTTMNAFPMCEECLREYDDPTNRRFFSQTNCCPQCGPKLQLVDAEYHSVTGSPIEQAAHLLLQGKIIAIKNTGGYLLCVDATNDRAVQQLRKKKRRRGKPFALLALLAEELAHVGVVGGRVLRSPAAPIVLLKKKGKLAPSVAHESPYYGVMLANTPLQHLLLRLVNRPLVATSGNVSGQPICIDENEAFEQLASIADFFLVHDRAIAHRLDDSVVHVMAEQPVVVRRGRGYVPDAFSFYENSSVFAAGSHMKNSFAFSQCGQIYMSQYIGDLDSSHVCQAYEREIESWKDLLSVKDTVCSCDCHPGYYSSQYVEHKDPVRVQHHIAHALSGAIDNDLAPPFVSIAWDGTGWGDEAVIWGGEAFHHTEHGVRRIGTLYPFPLPGGEVAVREPRRSLLGMMHVLGRDDGWNAFSDEERSILTNMLEKNINSPMCHSVGRLFDGVSALFGLCRKSEYEGQAALLLEKEARCQESCQMLLPIVSDGEIFIMDWRPMVLEILERGPCKVHAYGFHDALARAICSLAQCVGEKKVLLTGGVMQNRLLVELAVSYLKEAGFVPYIHKDIPPNDSGIAVGQILGRKYVSCNTR